jgi:aminopeptidase
MATDHGTMLQRYADVTLRVGLALQPGQRLIVRAWIDGAPLMRAIAARAYELGSRLVTVIYNDEMLGLARLQHAPRDSFSEAPGWIMEGVAECMRQGDAYLQITGDTPGLLDAQDPATKSEMSKAGWAAYKPVLSLQEENAVAWSLVSAATPGWAAKVFPNLTPEAAIERLWDAIFEVCRLKTDDPVAAWQRHIRDLSARCQYLNHKQYTTFRYSGPGTSLTVGMPEHHVWLGGSEVNKDGMAFVANLPTEEIFSTPHRARVSGTVVSSLPLSYQGSILRDLALTFADGKVVHASARQGEGILRGLIETDDGSAQLGEIALVSHASPIARSGIVFYNTLFDENAASHLAFGSAYKACIEGGMNLSDDAFQMAGGNTSSVHVDFMIGSAEMSVDGILPSGASEPVMRKGDWAFDI